MIVVSLGKPLVLTSLLHSHIRHALAFHNKNIPCGPESIDYVFSSNSKCPLLAEDCLPPRFYERLLWRKLTLKLSEAAAANDLI